MVVSRKIEGKEGYDSEPTRNEAGTASAIS